MWLLLAIALPLTRALVHRLALAAERHDSSTRTAKALHQADSTVTAVSSGRPVREDAAQQNTDPLRTESPKPGNGHGAGDVRVTGDGELGRTARAAGAVGQPQRQEQEPRTPRRDLVQASECFYQRHAVRQAGQVGRCAALGRPIDRPSVPDAGDAPVAGRSKSSRAEVPASPAHDP